MHRLSSRKYQLKKKVKLTALRKSIWKVLINKIVTNKPVPEETDPLRIPIKKIGIINFNSNWELIILFVEFKPKPGLRKEYIAKIIEISPNIKYKYCSEMNFTIDDPKITPGVPKNNICHKTKISFLRYLKFLIDPPKPKATVATLWVARAW